ncbi:hypothetical protein TRIATDRAFT_259599 [Trichoderma atroviride IMI 206040]|uniref:Uncharacterized protein n=1 Tax=Hypocrea atroviridis (strain ATCC 20476 / IMI 206040) TaxID=452589 RepID=G9P480_HYPAI|nr:uncharacterized protein TRIATDRAFT_259599 [Trichoderma atroviride IMI 206040]EHK41924.1 hypothetical protein TRIATDRAFT_259599 [Trichoderma atroviride IMI 206040]
MNNVRSFRLGWGSLFLAGGGAYYFAKQNVKEQRVAKLKAQREKQAANWAIEHGEPVSSGNGVNGGPARTDNTGLPSQEASSDPAATRHAPATESEQVAEKSKYESAIPMRTRKGDRFS